MKQPTCTEEGVAECRCTCGDVWTEAIPALGHAWDAGVVTKEPTDTEKGVKTYTCTRCGETKEEKGHYEQRETKAAWDETTTVGVAICNGCGMEFSPVDYGSGDAAAAAAGNHVMDADFDSNCDSYHVESREVVIHHEAEYEDVWVAD